MNQNIYRFYIALLAILIISGNVRSEIEVSQSLSDEQIAFEDSVQFEIMIEWQGAQSMYLFNKPLTPFIDRMKIGNFSSSVSSLQKNGVEFTQKKYNYTLIPTSAGLGIIDSIYISYLKRNDTVPITTVTEPMQVLILTPVPKVKDSGVNNWLIYALLVVVGVGGLSFWKIKKNAQEVEVPLTPKEKLLQVLTAIKENSESDMKKFQTELYSALTSFIVTNYNLDVSLVKTDMLVEELSKAGISIAQAEQIEKWLKQAEIDKFAPIAHSPGAVVRLESEIRNFVDKI